MDAATREKIRQYILSKCDQNKNGQLDRRELQRAYYYVRKNYEKYFDTNHNGRLDGHEYQGVTAFLGQFR